jgi:hypothetical protein
METRNLWSKVYVLLIVLVQTYQIIYNGGKFMLAMVVGEYSTSQSFACFDSTS